MNELLNDLILADGEDVRKEGEKKPSRDKTNYVKLKDGQQLRGFLLTDNFVMYMRHGDYEKGIKSHTCRDPRHGVNCISCQHGVKRVKSTIVPFYNVDTQQVEIFDASNKAMKAIFAFCDEYEGEVTTTAVALKRSGASTDTTYALMPVRIKPAEKELFQVPSDIVIDAEFYMAVLNPPDDEYVKKLIGIADETEEQIQTIDLTEDEMKF